MTKDFPFRQRTFSESLAAAERQLSECRENPYLVEFASQIDIK